jgi:hypothetical protein
MTGRSIRAGWELPAPALKAPAPEFLAGMPRPVLSLDHLSISLYWRPYWEGKKKKVLSLEIPAHMI